MAHDGIRSRMYPGQRIIASAPPEVFNIPKPPDWTELAVCNSADPESWFPQKGSDNRQAKAICRSCPAVQECLEFALENRERHGIWGGLSERQRRPLERALGRPGMAPLDRSRCGSDANARAHRRRGEEPCAPCAQAANVVSMTNGMSGPVWSNTPPAEVPSCVWEFEPGKWADMSIFMLRASMSDAHEVLGSYSSRQPYSDWNRMSDPIDELVDWQLTQQPPEVQVCRVCLAAWTVRTNDCPHCGITQ